MVVARVVGMTAVPGVPLLVAGVRLMPTMADVLHVIVPVVIVLTLLARVHSHRIYPQGVYGKAYPANATATVDLRYDYL